MTWHDVVQLRIHGVGGATPEGLLGLTDGSETVRVAGDEAAGFYARPSDPRVQGYVWWKLTSGTLAQALWIVLLPFTLFNVANWMYPRGDGRPNGWARVISRFLMFMLGLSLTFAYLLWGFTLVVQQLFYQWGLGGRLDHVPNWSKVFLPAYFESVGTFRAGLGILGVVVAGVVVLLVARRTRRDFEHVHGPRADLAPGLEPTPAVLGFPMLRTEQLNDDFFWSHAKDSTRLLWVHMLAGTAMFGGLVAWALPLANASEANLHLRRWFIWLAAAQLLLIGALLLLYLVGWGWRSAFHFAPPVVVAVVSVIMTTGFFTGFTFWLARRLNIEVAALDFDQTAAFGLAAIAFALLTAWWLWLHVHRRLKELDQMEEEEEPPPNTAPPGHEANGVSPWMLRKLALVRSFSGSLTRIDVILTGSAVVFVGAATTSLFIGQRLPAWFTIFGRWVLSVAVALALPALLLRSFRPNANSKVKIIWDSTTFWPRRFHPLAVRPYAERSVPEIQGRLFHLVQGQHARVVIAAHSQGSVLAYCALVHMAAWTRGIPDPRGTGKEIAGSDITRNVALVTFGCPLYRMHARFFPAYFDHPEDFLALRSHLFSDGDPRLTWANFYRRTDYVGQDIFASTDVSSCDQKIPDPPEAPSRADLPSPGSGWEVSADAPQPIFTKLMVHSYYNNAVELRTHVDDVLRDRLGRG